MPLHLNWQLYGWCALPLLGALLHYYAGGSSSSFAKNVGARSRATKTIREQARSHTSVIGVRLALGVWSLALAYGGFTWLCGESSGNPFLDWTGPARVAWSLALLACWLLIARQALRHRATIALWAQALLAVLFAVPFLLYWALGRGEPRSCAARSS